MKMRKFFKILKNGFLMIMIIASLLSIIFVFLSWNDEIDEIVINNVILLRAETTFLDSEDKLPPESSFEEDKKAKLFIIPWRNVLKFRFLDPEISEYYLKQEMKIKPSKHLQHEALRLIGGPPNFYIKNVSLKGGNLLEIELGFRKGAEIIGMFPAIILIILAICILKIPNQEKEIEVIETVLKQKS